MDNGMRVTCRFLQDALNAVVASYLQLHRRRFARIPETRRLFMYSKLTEYMNNYDRAPRRREGNRDENGEENERRENERESAASSILLIRSIYRRHVAAFTFTSPRFSVRVFQPRSSIPGNHSFPPPRPDIIRDVNVPSCTTCFRLRVQLLFFPRFRIISSFDFPSFPIRYR